MAKLKNEVHFLHIGKTGGSAVKESLKKYLDKGKFKLVFHRHDFKLKDVPIGVKIVFFLREPISRFVSGFYSRRRMGRPLYNFLWRPSEAKAFRKFKTPNELAEELSSINKDNRDRAVHAMRNVTHIKSRYWYWFKNKKYFKSRIDDVLFVGTQENLDKDFKKLLNILEIPTNIKLTKDKKKMHKNPTNVDKRISSMARDNLIKWYKKEYEFIQFCRELKLIK